MLASGYDREAMGSFLHTLDREHGLLVVLMRATPSKDEEGPLIASLESLYEDRNLRRDLVMVTVIGESILNSGSPTFRKRIAASRKRMLETSARSARPGTLVAVVTGSVLIRATATALDWLHPPPPQLLQSFLPSFDAAVVWCEAQRGEPLPSLRMMHARLNTQNWPHQTAAR